MIQVLNRAFRILEFIAQAPESPKSLGEIVRACDLHRATCANILKTLLAHNYVEQSAPRKGYLLGPRAYWLSQRGPYRKDLVIVAEPIMVKLSQDLRETVLIATLNRGKRFVLCRVEGAQAVRINSDLLFREDVYETSTGRVLLAALTGEELRTFVLKNGLPGNAWPEAQTKEKLSSALERIRKERIATSVVESQAVQIACPVSEGPRTVAALGLFLPMFRFRDSHEKKVLAGIRTAAEEISSKLSDSPKVLEPKT